MEKDNKSIVSKEADVMTLAPVKYDIAIESIATLKEEAELNHLILKVEG